MLRYRDADKSLARPGRKQANVSVRMAWIFFGHLTCRKITRWQLAPRCCWNCARPWHSSELVSFLVGLRTYQHPSVYSDVCLFPQLAFFLLVCPPLSWAAFLFIRSLRLCCCWHLILSRLASVTSVSFNYIRNTPSRTAILTVNAL